MTSSTIIAQLCEHRRDCDDCRSHKPCRTADAFMARIRMAPASETGESSTDERQAN